MRISTPKDKLNDGWFINQNVDQLFVNPILKVNIATGKEAINRLGYINNDTCASKEGWKEIDISKVVNKESPDIITNNDRKKIYELVWKGINEEEITKEVGKNNGKVKRIIKLYLKFPITPTQMNRMREMIINGNTIKEISAEIGRSWTSIHNWDKIYNMRGRVEN